VVPRFYNTSTRRKEAFEPASPPRVSVYSCGPTVYDVPHVGNYRFFVWVDLVHRYLAWRGYDVNLVMNITDIDDRTIAGAMQAGVALRDHTEPFVDQFLGGLEALGVRPAACYPRATDHVDEMVELISRLLAKDHAYVADGNVFFRVASFASYGQLARLDPEAMRSTERVQADRLAKEDPRDFTLWKAAIPDEPSWPAPFGGGRPGWHLECSAMSMKYLGETFDLHLGGADLIFPHHENEIAQSEAATGVQFVRYWMHCSHLIVDGTKMSKSLGNFYTLRQLLEAGHDPMAIRYLLTSVHYRRPLNFTFEAIEQAAASIARLHELLARIGERSTRLPSDDPTRSASLRAALKDAQREFGMAIDDDLNSAGALGHVFSLVREVNSALDRDEADRSTLDAVTEWLADVDSLWGVLPREERSELDIEYEGASTRASGPVVSPDIEALIVQRVQARMGRDFEASDALREQLRRLGIEVEDTPDGVRWRRSAAGSTMAS
jgi:cysteinyl-tRNA synthetase